MSKYKQPPVKDPRRAGQAPYNFVPLPERVRWLLPAELPPTQDRYHADRLTGTIEIDLDAVTDFYVRGMVGWNEYVSAPKGDKPEQVEPYQVEGKLAIPGSSLRGMFRSLVEIIGEAPLDPVNDSQLFFRTVGSTSNPGDKTSFEPHAVAYKSRIDPIRLPNNVKAGYLYGSPDDDQWTIVPAQSKDGRQFYQIPMAPKGGVLRDVWLKPAEVWFRPGRLPKYAEVANEQRPGFEPGVRICSGGISKKRHQWVIRPEQKGAKPVAIPEADVAAYRESGTSQAIKSHGFEYSRASQGIPCFYVEWTSPAKVRHVTFGHTYNMRIPYERSVAEAIPPECRRKPESWDLAQAIFGRLNDGAVKGARGRVSFEDALLAPGSPNEIDKTTRVIILGQPKPTTFQHYLVQPREDVVGSIHWDGNYKGEGTPVLRGHKLYHHRPGVPLAEVDPALRKKRENVTTKLRPAKKGCRFRARIRFENLLAHELGVLLTAIELPAGCAHKIGMAKPLGFGSMRCKTVAVELDDRAARYGKLFAGIGSDSAELSLGSMDASSRRPEWKDAFAAWIAGKPSTNAALWQTPRMAELKALLTIDGLPADWEHRTRYLEFGQTLDGVQYNEYKHIGYPKLNNYGRPFLEQRRPLPPASQVLSDRKLPAWTRPPFKDRDR